MLAIQVEVTVTNIVYTLAGIALGFFLGRGRQRILPERKHSKLKMDVATIRKYIAFLVTGVWLLSFALDAMRENYDPPPGINIAFAAVTTYLFVTSRNGKEVKEE